MPTPRFFIDEPLAGRTNLSLPAAVARHALDVLRLRVGDALVLFDGHGGEYRGRLESSRPAAASVGAFDPVDRESPLVLTLVQSLIANEKLDWVIEKATELGVQRIVIARAERSVVRLDGERLQKRMLHWNGVAVAACCQCGRNRVPVIEYAADLNAVFALGDENTVRCVLDPAAGTTLRNLAKAGSSYLLLVGPEGGLTEAELSLAARKGFQGLRFGPRVLRTETAGLAALSALQALHGDFGA